MNTSSSLNQPKWCFETRFLSFVVGVPDPRAPNTFTHKWPHYQPGRFFKASPRQLAACGLYYCPIDGTAVDNVCCYMCNKHIDGWESTDIPFLEHAKVSPECPLVRLDLEVNRVATFTGSGRTNEDVKRAWWPHIGVPGLEPQRLARAGFYYAPKRQGDDTCSCFQCGCVLDGWAANDNPLLEHKRRRERCPFLMTGQVHSDPYYKIAMMGMPDDKSTRELPVDYVLREGEKPIYFFSNNESTTKENLVPKSTDEQNVFVLDSKKITEGTKRQSQPAVVTVAITASPSTVTKRRKRQPYNKKTKTNSTDESSNEQSMHQEKERTESRNEPAPIRTSSVVFAAPLKRDSSTSSQSNINLHTLAIRLQSFIKDYEVDIDNSSLTVKHLLRVVKEQEKQRIHSMILDTLKESMKSQ